jgi:hypothetical protein
LNGKEIKSTFSVGSIWLAVLLQMCRWLATQFRLANLPTGSSIKTLITAMEAVVSSSMTAVTVA